jgi:hypothetical protein
MAVKTKYPKRQLTDEDIIRSLAKITDIWDKKEFPEALARTTLARKAGVGKPSDRWSFFNWVTMLAHGTKDARGANQWREVGRWIKKGTHGFDILGPKFIHKKRIDDEGNEETYKILVGFFPIRVHPYENTEGEPVVYPDYSPVSFPPLADKAKELGLAVKYAPFEKGYYGVFRPADKTIELCTHDVITFFHELAHAAHASFADVSKYCKDDLEIIAETVAVCLCDLYGYTGYEYEAYRYVQQHVKTDTPNDALRYIGKVLADIEKCLCILLDIDLASMPHLQVA